MTENLDKAIEIAAVSEAPRQSYSTVAKVIETLSHAATVFGIIIIIWQLNLDSDQRKAENSLQLVERFHSGSLSEDTDVINTFSFSRREQLVAFRRLGGAQDVETKRRWGEDEVAKFAEEAAQPDIYVSIYDISAFFNEMKTCVENNVCDKNILRAYFTDYAQGFMDIFGNVISSLERDTSTNNLGVGLRYFADMDSGDAQ
jgi:hypothetical protein